MEPPQVFFGPAGPHCVFTLAQVLWTLAEVIVLDVVRLQLMAVRSVVCAIESLG